MTAPLTLKEEDLTLELIKVCFDYNKDGFLVWKERPLHHFSSEGNCKRFNTPNAGKIAGYFNKRTDSKKEGFGYWRTAITLNGERGHFKLHRLIWFWHHGYFPEVVDHKDTDTNNNRIENLRCATVKTNSRNLSKSSSNVTGFKGVSDTSADVRRKIPYKAGIGFNRVYFSIGSYSTAEKAAEVYDYVAKLLFGEYANLNGVVYEDKDITMKGKFLTQTLPQLLDGTFDFSTRVKGNNDKRDNKGGTK